MEEPVDRVVEIGENTSLVRDGVAMQFDRALIMTATAYCPGTPDPVSAGQQRAFFLPIR